MSMYVIPRGADLADDLIAQLTSFGEYVVNAAPEYKWAETWAAKLLIAEADEVVCLPHWEDFGFGQRDRGLAVGKPMYVAHRDGDKHGALWRLEYEEESEANGGQEVEESKFVQEVADALDNLPKAHSWGTTGVTRAVESTPLATAVAELRDAIDAENAAGDDEALCRAALADAEQRRDSAWTRSNAAKHALIAAALA